MKARIVSILFLLGCNLSSHSLPSRYNCVPKSSPISNHIVVQGGGYWSSQGKAQHINIDGLIGNQFTVSRRSGSSGLVGLGYFIDRYPLNRIQVSYGLNLFYLHKTAVSGIVFQENLFPNLSYSYDVTHYPLYAAIKAISNFPICSFPLTIEAGIGPNFMRAGGFSEQSLDGGITIPDNAFASRTTTTFSATVGVGLQLDNVLSGIPFDCGYRFFYLGKGRFSNKTDQLLNTLSTGNAIANAVVCSIRI